MSEIKNGGLDQYGAEPFEQQQIGTAGVEGVNVESIQLQQLLIQYKSEQAVGQVTHVIDDLYVTLVMVCLCNVHAFLVMLAFVEHKQMFTYLLTYLHEL